MMQFDRSITSLGLGITYFVQVVVAYVTTQSICAFISNARVRVRLWGGFLVWTIAAWVLLWIPAQETRPVLSIFHSVQLPRTAELHIAMPVTDFWASYFARITPAIAFLYLSFLLISVLYLFFESRRLKSALRRTHPPSPRLRICFERLCRELHVGRCELRLAADLRSPAMCYWWRSHILLPLELVPHLDNNQLEDVLRHELFHVDNMTICGIGWQLWDAGWFSFHPLVWLAYRHLRWERELACDYEVVRESSEARLRYAECLTDLAPVVHGEKNVFAGNNFFFFRILAQSQSPCRSEQTLDLLRSSRSGSVQG